MKCRFWPYRALETSNTDVRTCENSDLDEPRLYSADAV
jgi:hypothetical protein